jgi:hypothetical protein
MKTQRWIEGLLLAAVALYTGSVMFARADAEVQRDQLFAVIRVENGEWAKQYREEREMKAMVDRSLRKWEKSNADLK